MFDFDKPPESAVVYDATPPNSQGFVHRIWALCGAALSGANTPLTAPILILVVS